MKRFLCVLLAAMLAATTGSCGQQSVAPPPSSSAPGPSESSAPGTATPTATTLLKDPNLNEPGTLPIAKEKITLKIGVPQNANVTSYTDNVLTRYVQDTTNIMLEWELYPASEAKQKIEVLVASHSKLPDVLMSPNFTDLEILNYGSNGVLLDLKEYYDTLSVNFYDSIAKTDTGTEAFMKMLIAPDGGIYSIPSIGENYTGGMWTDKMTINQKFLDAVGMEKPATTEELYQVLKAFKEKDPNGNKKPDEIPALGTTLNGGQNTVRWITNAFIYDDAQDRLINDGGVVKAAYVQPEWREALRYVKKLVSEELLSPLTFSIDYREVLNITAAGEIPTVGMVMPGGGVGNFRSMANERCVEYLPLMPITGPEGVAYSTLSTPKPYYSWNITRDCAYPEAAFMLGDFMLTEDFYMRGRYGEPGVDWKPIPEGEDAGVDDASGTPFKYLNITAIWGKPQQKHWNNANPGHAYRTMNESVKNVAKYTPAVAAWNDEIRVFYNALPKYGYEGHIPLIKYTLEENAQISEIRANLKTYMEESVALFATGGLDIEKDWDRYLNELEKIGLSKYLQVTQTAWERMYK